MKTQKFNEQFATFFDLAVQLCERAKAGALLVMLDGPTDWEQLRTRAGGLSVLVAGDLQEELASARDRGIATIALNMGGASVFEKLSQALLQGVARELVSPGGEVVALYSNFEPGKIDSISHIRLAEHLGRLTSRDLRQLTANIPLDTLKMVVDLAVEIGRDGREGKPVGTMFVIGDTRKVLSHSQSAGFDPVKGYSRKERDLHDPRVREAVKEIAPLDGAFVVSADGVVERSCRLVDAAHASLTLSKGLGARHWAAAAISKTTSAVSVVVSQSNGTVRIFQNGEVVLRVEPFRRAMKWKNFEYEPLVGGSEPRAS